MTAETARTSDLHLRLRIPGWLLMAALLVAVVFFGGRYTWGVIDNSNGGPDGFRMPMRVTALESSVDGNVLRAAILLENDETLDLTRVRFAVALDDGTTLPVAALIRGSGAWQGRSYVVDIEKLIPNGRTATTLHVTLPTAVFALPLQPQGAP